MTICAVNLGERQTINWKGKLITTGIFKYPCEHPIFLDTETVKNDAICDREHHGGIDQAVYAYSFQHYEYWKALYPELEWQFGMFGENLTLDDLNETSIHVGDTFKVGETILEATKPRQPCMKLGIRFNNMTIVKQFWQQHMPGVYFKVIKTGFVKTGDQFKLIKTYPNNPTISQVYHTKRLKNTNT